MLFQGRIYYDFSPAVWRFYRFLTAAAGAGAELRLEWRPYLSGTDPQSAEGLALVEAVRQRFPDRYGGYLQALLALRHLEGADLTDPSVAAAAAAAATIESPIAPDHAAALRSTEEGASLGVTGTPTIFRHGPVLHVGVTPASYEGDVLERLRLIDAVLADDGIWGLNKP
jgi:hypothetical protein